MLCLGFAVARTSGPPPKDPSQLARPRIDPVTGKDGWTEIEPTLVEGEIPAIPNWVTDVGEEARQVYEYLMRIPQARMYGPGTLFQLWLTLPLIQRYLETSKGSGVETYKGITSALGPALNLTESDLARARIKLKSVVEETEATPVEDEKVVHMNDRRKRLAGGK